MGSTNKTAHYELPQFVANDKPSWLGDVNQAMEAIDTGIFGAKSSADGAQTTANNAVAGVQTANTRMDGMQTQLDTIATQANQTATAVNQHTASIATNSANINTINSRLGNTDISDIGDGTVSGAIVSLAGGGGGASNVRWNSVTDRFEVLKNGNWVQSIRAFVNSIAVWVNGIFGISVDNGVYDSTKGHNVKQYTISGNNLVASGGASTDRFTLISQDTIDLTNYSKIKAITSEGTIECNVSGVSGFAYIYLVTALIGEGSNIQVGAASAKQSFSNNTVATAGMVEFNKDSISVSEITVE